MVFSSASLPYLSTSDLFFAPWVKHPAPPMHPPMHAIPSMKLASKTPFYFFISATLHSSIPSQIAAFNSNSVSSCSFIPSATASESPPERANIRPK